MSTASDLADKLEAYLPFAPMGVAEIAAEEIEDNWHRMSPVDQERYPRLVEKGKAMAEQRRQRGFACAFPVVLEPSSRLRKRLKGLVLEVRACLGQPDVGDAQPLLEAVHDSLDDDHWIEHLLKRSGISAFVAPHPENHEGVTLRLKGDSLEGAIYLAVMAAREGREFDGDVVASVALSMGPDGPYLDPVGSLEDKLAVLERERPECRFFYFPEDGEELHTDSDIELVKLSSGHAQRLFLEVFGEPVSGEQRAAIPTVLTLRDQANTAFFDQRYGEAEEIFGLLEAKLEELGDEPWHPQASAFRFEVAARKASLLLHAGKWDQAQPLLEQLRDAMERHEEINRLMFVEVLADLAAARIDAHDPNGAAEILERDLGEDLEDLSTKSRRLTFDEKIIMMNIYGAWRRVHLLRGDPDRALEMQQRLVRVAPPRERARALSDLGECQYRTGDFEGAMRTWDEAEKALRKVSSYYGLHTRAFLEYYRARADLVSQEGSTAALVLAERAGVRREAVKEKSAAHWRLTRLRALARCVHGVPGALRELTQDLDSDLPVYKRWCYALDLLWAAQWAKQHADEALRHAAVVLGAIPLPHYPELDEARILFCEAAQRSEKQREAIEGLLRRRVY
jgi:tetratricopeptide (TPR) repeat protein